MIACRLKEFNKIPALVEGEDKPNALQMANVDLVILIVAIFTSVEDTKSMAHPDTLWGLEEEEQKYEGGATYDVSHWI